MGPAPTTFAFFSALVCFTHRSCVNGRTVEIALESDSLLFPHVAPWSFKPKGHKAELLCLPLPT